VAGAALTQSHAAYFKSSPDARLALAMLSRWVARSEGLRLDGYRVMAQTLDPNRSYQPLRGRWPEHNVLPQACTMS